MYIVHLADPPHQHPSLEEKDINVASMTCRSWRPPTTSLLTDIYPSKLHDDGITVDLKDCVSRGCPCEGGVEATYLGDGNVLGRVGSRHDGDVEDVAVVADGEDVVVDLLKE